MPMLSNAKQERFAQELASGKSATDAMRAAGYGDPRNSTRLTKNDEIAARVRELQARASEGVVITRQGVLEELAKIAFAELGHTHVKAAEKRAALKDLAQIEGWIVERKEVGEPGEFDRYQSADELREAIKARFGVVPARSQTARMPSQQPALRRKPH